MTIFQLLFLHGGKVLNDKLHFTTNSLTEFPWNLWFSFSCFISYGIQLGNNCFCFTEPKWIAVHPVVSVTLSRQVHFVCWFLCGLFSTTPPKSRIVSFTQTSIFTLWLATIPRWCFTSISIAIVVCNVLSDISSEAKTTRLGQMPLYCTQALCCVHIDTVFFFSVVVFGAKPTITIIEKSFLVFAAECVTILALIQCTFLFILLSSMLIPSAKDIVPKHTWIRISFVLSDSLHYVWSVVVCAFFGR